MNPALLPAHLATAAATCPSPSFVLDWAALERNAAVLSEVQRQSGCRIVCALKGFAMWSTFDLLRKHLAGTTASGLHEALLGHEKFGGEVHVFSPAYKEPEILGLLPIAHHLSFNSLNQWRAFQPLILAHNRTATHPVRCGLRVNPEHSETDHDLYNPCAPCSRLGMLAAELETATEADWEGLDGLHFHTLCQKNSDALERTAFAFEKKFSRWLPRCKWFNFGGGHHLTRADYDIPRAVRVLQHFAQTYGAQVYLEPGEAVGLNTGVLVASVVDIVFNTMPIAILDVSATCHMPDVLEMPYRPDIHGGGEAGEKRHTYRLGGPTCLAGDVIGDWSFDEPLKIGDRLVFGDMIHYTMVKTTTFNGVPHPAICIWRGAENRLRVVREFGYEDYRNRLS